MFSILSHYLMHISDNILQVQRRSNFLQKWISRIIETFLKKSMICWLLEGFDSRSTHHGIFYYTVTIHKTILHHEFFLPISPSKKIFHTYVESHLPLNYPSWLRTHLSFWVAYISLYFSIHFSLSIKLSISLFHDYITFQ